MKRMLSVLLALVLCASCLTGCGGNSAAQTPEGSENGKILQLAVNTFPATMDPHEFSTIDEYCIDYNTYEPLVYVMDDGSVKNILAESYEISEDATQYTFKLRSGVKFHNGETMTADDVAFSINRAIEDPYMATYVSSISDVEKVDDSTVRVILSAPNAAFLRLGKYITILNESFCSEHESLSSVACGTGPYMLTDYQDGVSLTLSAFADYWDGAAEEIDGAVYNFIAGSATLVLAFETGDLDYINVPAADWDRISSDDSYKSESVTQDFVNWIVFNSEVAPLDDVRVRQAVACAINKEDVITMACNGVGTVANVLADPRIIDGTTDDVNYFTYDVARAKELLEQAGYPNGVDIGEFVYIGGTSYEKIATAVQNCLAEAGITCTLKSMDSSAIYDVLFGGNFSVGALASGLGRDYSLYSQLYTTAYYGSLDICRLQDPEVDAAFVKGSETMDKTEREAIYKELIDKLETGAYYVPISYDDNIWASAPAFTPFIDDGGMMLYNCQWEG